MESILANALRDYKAEFGEEPDLNRVPTCDQDLADELRASKVDFDSWRSKHGKMWTTLTAIALPITNLGTIAAEATSDAFQPASIAIHGLLSLVAACEKVSEAYDYIEQMFVKLEDVLSRWRIDAEHEVDDHLQERRQQILLVILSIITRSRRLLKRGRFRQYASRLVFGQDKKTTDLMQNLENLIQSEDRVRTTLSLSKISALWEKAIQSESAQSIEKLRSPAVETNEASYVSRLEDRIPDTGRWLKAEQLYQEWTCGNFQFMLIVGAQGSGKTYLATGIVEDLIQKYHRYDAKANATSVAYFYFEHEHDILTMLKTMGYQIQKTNPAYRQHIVETFEQGGLHTAKEMWAKLFLDFWNDRVNSASKLFLIIDGLSNGSPSAIESFAQDMVKALKQGNDYNIQLAISGKLQLLVDFDFIPRENFIEIDFKKNQEDLAVYIDKALSKHKLFRKDRTGEKGEIKDKIVESSDGSFEWARLLLERCKMKEPHRIRKLLEDPPESLDDMVKSCFDQIMADDDVDPAMLRTLLTWLTHSKRHLQFGEIYNAICLATGEQYAFLWRTMVYFLSTVIRWKSPQRGGLHDSNFEGGEDEDYVEVLEDEEEGWSIPVKNTYVFFANSRIRDYVIKQSNAAMGSDGAQSLWPPPPQQSECEIMKICLRTLQQDKVTELRHRWLISYPLHYMLLHLKNIDIATASADDKAEIASGLIWLFCEEAGHYVMAIDGGNNNTGGAQRFWNLWMETKDNMNVVQTWLKWAIDNDVKTGTQITEWLTSATNSYKALFQPFSVYAQRRWTGFDRSPKPWSSYNDSDWILQCCLAFLLAYDSLVSSGSVPSEISEALTDMLFQDDPEVVPHRYQIWGADESFTPSLEDIMVFAKKAGLREDAKSAPALALIFSHLSRPDLTIKYAKTISEDRDCYWFAAWSLAWAYTEAMDYDQALYWMKIAAEKNPYTRGEADFNAAQFMLRCSNVSGAIEAAEKGYRFMLEHGVRFIHYPVWIYLHSLSLHQEWQTVIKVARQLHTTTARDEATAQNLPYSKLIHVLSAGYGSDWNALGQAYMFSQSQDDKQFIMGIIQGGEACIAQALGEYHQVLWLNSAAQFTCRYVDNGWEKGRVLFAANLLRIKESRLLPDETLRTRILLHTMTRYSRYTYLWALEQERNSNSRLADTVKVLETLSRDAQQIHTSSLTVNLRWQLYLPSLYYGCWLRSHSIESSAHWMTFFREPMLAYLNMLDDPNPQNDFFGFERVLWSLKLAQDYTNCRALLAVQLLQLEQKARKIADNQSHQDRNSVDQQQPASMRQGADNHSPIRLHLSKPSMITDGFGNLQLDNTQIDHTNDVPNPESTSLVVDLSSSRYYCDSCDALFYKVDAMFTCQQCRADSCNLCLPKGPIHPLLGRICGDHHEYIQCWPLPDEIKYLAAVEEGDKIRLRRSWLERLREEWKAPC